MDEIPEPLGSFEALLAASLDAPDCGRLSLDGMTYRHQGVSDTETLDGGWDTPTEYEHQEQMAIIDAYSLLRQEMPLAARG